MQEPKNYILEKIKTANPASIIIIVFCGSFLISLLFVEVPENNRDIVNFLSGSFFGYALGGAVKHLFDYVKKDRSD